MQPQLISHSPDLQRLLDDGYQLEICGAHLLVHHIPYLNSKLEVKYGTLVDALTYAGPTRAGRPQDHTIYLQGEMPCDIHGQVLVAIIIESRQQHLSQAILVNHRFSSKPSIGY